MYNFLISFTLYLFKIKHTQSVVLVCCLSFYIVSPCTHSSELVCDICDLYRDANASDDAIRNTNCWQHFLQEIVLLSLDHFSNEMFHKTLSGRKWSKIFKMAVGRWEWRIKTQLDQLYKWVVSWLIANEVATRGWNFIQTALHPFVAGYVCKTSFPIKRVGFKDGIDFLLACKIYRDVLIHLWT